MHKAAGNGHTQIVLDLLRHGAEVNSIDNGGYSTLFRAVANGSKDVVEVLLAHGARCDLKSSHGWSPVGAATVEKRTDSLELTIKSRTDMNTPVDPKGSSIWRFAIEENLVSVQETLDELTPHTDGHLLSGGIEVRQQMI